MLNGDGDENGIKVNRSNQQKKNKFARAAHRFFFFFQLAKNKCSRAARFFFLISKKKQICTYSTLFCLSFPLFGTTTMPFCTNETSNQFLVTHYFYGGIVVYTYQRFCFCVHVHFYFFTAAHFHLAGRQHFSFPHLCHEIFMFFFQRNFSPLFSITRSKLFPCYPLECKHRK